MRKLILSGDDWFELKHTLELLVIATHNEANEFEAMAAHQPAEIAERAATSQNAAGKGWRTINGLWHW